MGLRFWELTDAQWDMVVDGQQSRIEDEWVRLGWLARQIVSGLVGSKKAPKYDEEIAKEFERRRPRRRPR